MALIRAARRNVPFIDAFQMKVMRPQSLVLRTNFVREPVSLWGMTVIPAVEYMQRSAESVGRILETTRHVSSKEKAFESVL